MRKSRVEVVQELRGVTLRGLQIQKLLRAAVNDAATL